MSRSNALRQIAFYAGMIFIVLVLYVLSVGPAVWLFARASWLDYEPNLLNTLYFPIWALEDAGADMGVVYWYIQLWSPGV